MGFGYYDDQFQSPLSTISFINRYLEELDIASVRPNRATAPSVPIARQRKWIPPSGNAAKLNVNGGISLGDKGVAAAVARDKSGHFLGASALVIIGLVNPASLEAHACSEALALAQDLHL
ncbi:uncharacterized protein [Aegilops tauschii subsp. strangulata]|uniref:uncharacterized protein n=1 Tax=Aegilops tauschii subsp. strangulata TaxID=200361 RepID=UPI003CC8CDC8